MRLPFPFTSLLQFGRRTTRPGFGFEPLLNAHEAAALLRMHPKTLQKKARIGGIPWPSRRQMLALSGLGPERLAAAAGGRGEVCTRVLVRTMLR